MNREKLNNIKKELATLDNIDYITILLEMETDIELTNDQAINVYKEYMKDDSIVSPLNDKLRNITLKELVKEKGE